MAPPPKPSTAQPRNTPIVVSDLHDFPELCSVLKTAVGKYFIDQGFVEDLYFSNVRLLVSLVLCVAGAISHFWPTPHPQNIPLLVVCLLIYFGGSSFTWWLQRKHPGFFWTKPHSRSQRPGVGIVAGIETLTVANRVPGVTLSIGWRDDKLPAVSSTSPITRWFMADKTFDARLFETDVAALHKALEARPKKD